MRGGILLLDFDGVLAPLVPDPAAARADPECLRLLAEAAPAWRVAVVSGRSCQDLLSRLAPVQPDAVSGDHGLEIRLREGRVWVHPEAVRLRPRVLAVARQLGGRVEEKRLTAKTYGGVPSRRPPDGVRLLTGRGGTDVLPAVDWDKGRACSWLLDAWGWPGPDRGGPAVYVGDEATDEEAFQRLAPRGVLTVRIAPDGRTAAAHTLPDQSAVAGFLRTLVAGGLPPAARTRRPDPRGPETELRPGV